MNKSEKVDIVRQEMDKVSVDTLTVQKSLLNLGADEMNGDFGLTSGFILTSLMCDLILVEYVDESDNGEQQIGGFYLPSNYNVTAYRKARVLMVGPSVKNVQVGDLVTFPNEKGNTLTGVEVEGYGIVKRGRFLDERRILGTIKRK